MRKEHTRWKAVALLATGAAIGLVVAGTPAGAHVGSWTHNWTAHIRPKADPRYLPGGNLPGGRTIRGTYRVTGNDQGTGLGLGSGAISFGYRLASAPAPHFRVAGSAPTATCPGTAASPQAARGHLCVYEAVDTNAQGQQIANPVTNLAGQATRFGAFVLVTSTADGAFASGGTWAVTSP